MTPMQILEQLAAMEEHIACEAETHAEQTINGKIVRIERRHAYDAFGKGWSFGVWFVEGVETASVDLPAAIFGVSKS